VRWNSEMQSGVKFWDVVGKLLRSDLLESMDRQEERNLISQEIWNDKIYLDRGSEWNLFFGCPVHGIPDFCGETFLTKKTCLRRDKRNRPISQCVYTVGKVGNREFLEKCPFFSLFWGQIRGQKSARIRPPGGGSPVRPT